MATSQSYTRENLLAMLRDLAARLDVESVSRSTWVRETGVNEHQVRRLFDSWNEFVRAAGLKPDDRSRISDDELFEALRDACLAAQGVVTRTRLHRFGRHSESVYIKRWGRWQNVLVRFRGWVEQADPAFAYLADLPADSAPSRARRSRRAQRARTCVGVDPSRAVRTFLNFRGLQHAPINEQGVVFLFGMVAFDLAYMVEGVGTGFPDCEAKRCLSRSGDVWERVSIEFEFRSRNFLTHGHDPVGCDVIVCWEHNWPECPIEVLELRAVLDELGE